MTLQQIIEFNCWLFEEWRSTPDELYVLDMHTRIGELSDDDLQVAEDYLRRLYGIP